jgi:hypothetical protein
MAMVAQLHTLHGLAVELGRDVRLLQRALAGVPPDDASGKHRRWRLTTALAALEAHGHVGVAGTRNGSSSKNGGDLDRSLDDLERAARQLEDAFDQLEAERDIEKRRAQAKHVIGPVLREFEAALAANAAALPPHIAALTEAARSEMFGEAVGRGMALLRLRLAPEA